MKKERNRSIQGNLVEVREVEEAIFNSLIRHKFI